MTKKEVIELYIDWAYDRRENIKMSDVFCACEEFGFDYDKIVDFGDKLAKELNL